MNLDKNPSLFQINYSLGFLELEVMRIIWRSEEISVREVVNIIREKRPVAYTTIMTVMDNLYKKGFLTRKKVKKSYYYLPTNAEKQVVIFSLKRAIANLRNDYGKKQVLLYALAATVLPDIHVVVFPPSKAIKMYKAPFAYGTLFTFLIIIFGLSTYDLFQNFQYFGTFDYLKLFSAGQISSIDQLRLSFSALLESLPIINTLTTVVSSFMLFILVKKLLRLFDFRTPFPTHIGGVAS